MRYTVIFWNHAPKGPANIASSRLASIQNKEPFSQSIADEIAEQSHEYLGIGCSIVDKIAAELGLDPSLMGDTPFGMDVNEKNRFHFINLENAIEEYLRETGKSPMSNKRLTWGFREWLSIKLNYPFEVFPEHRFSSEKIGRIQLFNNLYIILYEDQIKTYFGAWDKAKEQASSETIRFMLEHNFAKLTVERILEKVAIKMETGSWKINNQFDLLKKFENLFTSKEIGISVRQKRLLLNELNLYRIQNSIEVQNIKDADLFVLDSLFQEITHAGTSNHDPKFMNLMTYYFQVYIFVRYTMGLDPLTCQFVEDILKWTRHHNKQNPETIPIFVEDSSSPNGYKILLVPVILELHGSPNVKSDPNTRLTLHGSGPKAALSNLIAEERFRHLIELTVDYIQTYKRDHGGNAPSLTEMRSHYETEFRKKTFDASGIDKITAKYAKKYWNHYKKDGQTDMECLMALPLWGEFAELNIEGMSENIINQFAEAVFDWNRMDEAAWFNDPERKNYKIFYNEKWLPTKADIIKKYNDDKMFWFIIEIINKGYYPDGYKLEDFLKK